MKPPGRSVGGGPARGQKWARAGLLGVVVLLVTVSGIAPAWAEPSPQTQHLCSEAAVPCSVQADFHQREGAAGAVMVTGRARTVVSLRVFRLEVVDGRSTGINPVGEPVEVRTDDSGFGSGNLPFNPLGPDQDGGWILVAPDDVTWDSPSDIVGVVAGLSARRPTILGDGFAGEKPVGEPLELQVTNAIVNTRFTVEYLADDGSWIDVSSSGAPAVVSDPAGITSVSYTVPQGLAPRPYYFRLLNLTDQSATPQQWQVTPSLRPTAQVRTAPLQVPELGHGVEGARSAGHHPQSVFTISMGTTGVTALIVLICWVGVAANRRANLVKALRG